MYSFVVATFAFSRSFIVSQPAGSFATAAVDPKLKNVPLQDVLTVLHSAADPPPVPVDFNIGSNMW